MKTQNYLFVPKKNSPDQISSIQNKTKRDLFTQKCRNNLFVFFFFLFINYLISVRFQSQMSVECESRCNIFYVIAIVQCRKKEFWKMRSIKIGLGWIVLLSVASREQNWLVNGKTAQIYIWNENTDYILCINACRICTNPSCGCGSGCDCECECG